MSVPPEDELPDNNYDEARRWLGQADEDLVAARLLAENEDAPGRVACFLAHLVAEKALKAVLIDSEVPFKKIHDLPGLLAMIPEHRRTPFDAAALERLNPWVIDGRYADDQVEASHEHARELTDLAQAVLAASTSLLRDERAG